MRLSKLEILITFMFVSMEIYLTFQIHSLMFYGNKIKKDT